MARLPHRVVPRGTPTCSLEPGLAERALARLAAHGIVATDAVVFGAA